MKRSASERDETPLRVWASKTPPYSKGNETGDGVAGVYVQALEIHFNLAASAVKLLGGTTYENLWASPNHSGTEESGQDVIMQRGKGRVSDSKSEVSSSTSSVTSTDGSQKRNSQEKEVRQVSARM